MGGFGVNETVSQPFPFEHASKFKSIILYTHRCIFSMAAPCRAIQPKHRQQKAYYPPPQFYGQSASLKPDAFSG